MEKTKSKREKEIMNSKINESALLNDPSVSYWLKEQIRASKERDILDALCDAELLVAVLAEREKLMLRCSHAKL